MMRRWIVTVGGAGLIPGAPGTYGSFVTAAALWAIYAASGGLSPLIWTGVLIAGLILASILCVALGPFAVEHFGRKDPGPMVLDEAAGICLTFLMLPIAPGRSAVITAIAAFVAFRLFDVTKPFPCRRLEKLPQGWGILSDDLMAAIYANLLCQIVLRWALPFIIR